MGIMVTFAREELMTVAVPMYAVKVIIYMQVKQDGSILNIFLWTDAYIASWIYVMAGASSLVYQINVAELGAV